MKPKSGEDKPQVIWSDQAKEAVRTIYLYYREKSPELPGDEKMKIEPNKYYLRIYDNYHFVDEEEAYNSGSYDTYEEAVVAAKIRIDDGLAYDLKFGIKPEDLNLYFSMFGEAPVVIPYDPNVKEPFSALDYARTKAEEICNKLKYE